MYEKMFSSRLSELRIQKGISARDMSLSLGQNPGYINSIESGKSLPSMNSFFYICEFLNITPAEFFNESISRPDLIRNIIKDLEKLNNTKLENISRVIKDLCE